jgi:hypothetical protein
VAIVVGDRFLHKDIRAFRDGGVSGVGAGGEEEPAAKEEDKEKDKEEDEEEEIMTIAEIQVWQASHGLRVARAYYVVNKEFLSRLGLELLWEF